MPPPPPLMSSSMDTLSHDTTATADDNDNHNHDDDEYAAPPPSLLNSMLDDVPFRALSAAQLRLHPKYPQIPKGVPHDVAVLVLFGLVLTDPWNHPSACWRPNNGFYHFSTLPKVSNRREILSRLDPDELVQALLVAIAAYKTDAVAFLTERKAFHQVDYVIRRKFDPEDSLSGSGGGGDGYVVALCNANRRAFIAFSGSKEWRHLKEALTFLPGSINGMPAVSSLGCHAGYLRVAEQVPDLIGSLHRMGYTDIILAGHSRGGALAHLVLLLHLYKNGITDDPIDSPSEDDDDDDSIMSSANSITAAGPALGRSSMAGASPSALATTASPSANAATGNPQATTTTSAAAGDGKPRVRAFAFGSPFVVNEAVSKYLSDHNLHHRFLSVVNDGDVVPGAMSSLGGLSAADISSLTGKLAGVDIDALLRTVSPLIGAALGYPIPAALGTAVTGFLWNSFWSNFVSAPILQYRPIGVYCFMRKRYGVDTGQAAALTSSNIYLRTPDTTESLESVLVHFQNMARDFSLRTSSQYTVAELQRHHGYEKYFLGITSTFGIIQPMHAAHWTTRVRPISPLKDAGDGPQDASIRVPGEWHPMVAAAAASNDKIRPGHERSPELAQDMLSPIIHNVIGQQVVLGSPTSVSSSSSTNVSSNSSASSSAAAAAVTVSPRKIKLDILGQNLDLIDMKAGIVLEKFFVDPVVLNTVIARTKDKMVVEATVLSAVERLPNHHRGGSGSGSNVGGGGPNVIVKSVHQGARPITKRITSLVTIDADIVRLSGGQLAASPSSTSLADGTVFDVAINAFKRAVINRSHELRAERMGFTAQRGVQERLLQVKAAFERLEVLCPPPRPSTSAAPSRSMSELIEVLARVDADTSLPTMTPPAAEDAAGYPSTYIADAADALLLDSSSPAAQAKERDQARIVMSAMDEATKRCGSFLQALCSRIDITLEPSVYFVVGSGVLTGAAAALSIGLLLPEAPMLAVGIGMGFLTSTAVGPLGLGDKIIHAIHREQDNQYRFLLMELVKWIGVPSNRLEFLNAHTHETAIEDRLVQLRFDYSRPADVKDPKRWMNWDAAIDVSESSSSGDAVVGVGGARQINGALFNEELFGPGKQFDRATRSCLGKIATRVEMVRHLHRIRRLIVEESVVSLVGTQDAGKTTAARRLFPHVEREFSYEGPSGSAGGGGVDATGGGRNRRGGMYEHTRGVRIFPHGRLAVADFPGSDSTAFSLDQAMRRFGGVASVALLFCHFNGDASGEVLRNLEEIKDWSSRIPILLCIHQAGNKVNSDPSAYLFKEELTCREDVNRFIYRWCRTIENRFPSLRVTPAVSLASSSSSRSSVSQQQQSLAANGVASMSTPPPTPKVSAATGSTGSTVTTTTTTAMASPGITVCMSEFAKELDLCKSYGIWGVGEVRRWITERILESNGFISKDDLLEVLPDVV